jgi:hypothetical protein
MKSEKPGKPKPTDKPLSPNKGKRTSKTPQLVTSTPTATRPTTAKRVHPNQPKPFVSAQGEGEGREKEEDSLASYIPKTPLGQRLLEIRARSIAAGMKLLSEEELDKEIAERKGGVNAS